MTIAFSTKSNRWTSRYSFEPQAYFHVDQQLLSFTQEQTAQMLWRHDATERYNEFYGTNYPTEFSVVSNENPSATKEYEAFSIEESDYNGWTVEFESASGETGTVTNLVKKEEDFYAPIPRSEGYGSGRLIYLGMVNPSDLTVTNINNKTIPMVSVDDYFARGPLAIFAAGELKVLKFETYFVTSDENVEVELNLISLQGADGSPASDDENFVFSSSLESGVLSIEDRLENQPTLYAGATSVFNTLGSNPIPIYAIDTSSGLSMRGDWLKATFKTFNDQPNIEVYAVNIDQHNISLDHSLGQNN